VTVTWVCGGGGRGVSSSGGSHVSGVQIARGALNLLILSVALWVISWWPSRWLAGESGSGWMTRALLIVVIPGFINLLLSGLPILKDPLKSVLVMMGLRVSVLLVSVLAVKVWRPDVGITEFYGWLMGFYLVSLAFESWEVSVRVRGK